jgi:hypothetical protein
MRKIEQKFGPLHIIFQQLPKVINCPKGEISLNLITLTVSEKWLHL